MALSRDFQIGLELTNVTAPLGNFFGRMCNLALADAIKRSGSDVITEAKLAALLGRHRIDNILKAHFRSKVASSSQLILSRYINITLHSGAGPSVQEALKSDNPALFSMIVQLSLLTFACEQESLAFAITIAVESILEQAGESFERAPDYVSLLGTITACRQQTAAFQWNYHFDAVISKIEQALHKHDTTPGRLSDPRKANFTRYYEVIADRSPPYTAFKALIRFIPNIQNFPEEAHLHLFCSTGLVTIIVWCHYVLGIDLIVWMDDCGIKFGDGEATLTLQASQAAEERAILYNARDRREPLFTLAPAEDDPLIRSEVRFEAKGFLRREIWATVGGDNKTIQDVGHWLISKALSIRRGDTEEAERMKRKCKTILPTASDIVDAGFLLLDLPDPPTQDKLNTWEKVEFENLPKNLKDAFSNVDSGTFRALIFAFARVSDRSEAASLPLSFTKLRSLETYIARMGLDCRVATLAESFEIILALLVLDEDLSVEDTSKALLMSGWGWSVYLGCFSLCNPIDVDVTYFQVKPGVPVYRDDRKVRILDGDTRSVEVLPWTVIDEPSEIRFLPGVSTAKMGKVLVGNYDTRTVSVIQLFKWQDQESQKIAERRLGFREMFNLRLQCELLFPCADSLHRQVVSGDNTSIDSLKGMLSKLGDFSITQYWPLDIDNTTPSLKVSSKPRPSKQLSLHDWKSCLESQSEAVLKHESQKFKHYGYLFSRWLFKVSNNPAAKWLQLSDLPDNRSISCDLISDKCCLPCALSLRPLRRSEFHCMLC